MKEKISAGTLVLASRSPRRRALLEAAGIPFVVCVSGIEEEPHQYGSPQEQAIRTARAKAEAVAADPSFSFPDESLILAADTMVVLDEEIFNKPIDAADARRMLTRLAGRWHTVVTGLCLGKRGGPWREEAVEARVLFQPFDADLIERYIASGEPDDKAGSYGIQGLGARLVAEVDGDLTCVIGLPMLRLMEWHRESTGRRWMEDGTLRATALRAFPDLAALPEACLRGMDSILFRE